MRFTGFSSDWSKLSLEEIGEFKNGINKSSDDFGHGVPFINLMDVFGKPTIYFGKHFGLVNANKKEIDAYELRKGDVLFIRSSVKKSGVGETSVIMEDLPKTVYSGFLIRFRDTKIKIDLNYKKYCFCNPKFRNDLISLSSTSANTNINQESLNSLNIYLPQDAEQAKISHFLSLIDIRIDTQSKIIKKLESSIIKLGEMLFDQKIRFPRINGHWKETTLNQECVINPKSPPLEEEFGYIDLESVAKGVLQKKQFLKKIEAPSRAARVLQNLDIIFQCVRPYQMNNLIYISEDNRQWVASTGYAQIRANGSTTFMYYLLNQPKFNKQVMIRCTGTSYPAISANDLGKINIKVCSKLEQEKIGQTLFLMDQKLRTEKLILEKYNSQKKYFLTNLFI
ncbi:hypothetical protein GM921_09620 [Pedobacter sp. LMG 31464]|uniref:Type I restriction modification DNA specificity domain-containing protein n=1 Tax=Pedobacter planticolens TaxID=2679964 RepID=A0A923DXB0_9SPHI|nr:restriction endonuclease subunit S [Pedobacter planticolens]MBB2145744.1 hypothetical protein [Pedobacter planticolens]